jgi:tripartite-type tricarboxylate transporter receptor subunit TctC
MPNLRRRQLLVATATLPAASLLSHTGFAADSFPDHAVKLIIPYPPGGGGDLIGRMIAPGLGTALGQAMIVDNHGGGAQVIATELAAKAPPDGYTLFLSSTTHAVNPELMKHLPYDTVRDFAAITIVATSPLVFVANPSLGVASIPELVAKARAEPGKINFASSGPGTGGHLSVEMLKFRADINMVHIPYKGSTGALTDVLGGQVQVMCTSLMSAMPYVKAGRLKGLAVTGVTRTPIAPELPTVAEYYPGYQSTLWYGLLTQVRTQAAVQKRLYDAAMRTLHDPKLIGQFKDQGVDIVANTPQQADAYIRSEIAYWGKLIQHAGIKGTGV